MDDFERKWRLIHEQLLGQASGAEAHAVVSRRTLFGIRSSVEEKMDRFAREIEAEHAAKRRAVNGGGAGELDRPCAEGYPLES